MHCGRRPGRHDGWTLVRPRRSAHDSAGEAFDFVRDFRSDTVHPSTLRLFSELGLLDRLLQRPHDKVSSLDVHVGGRHMELGEFSRFDPRWNFIAMMPQGELLDLIADEARVYPHSR